MMRHAERRTRAILTPLAIIAMLATLLASSALAQAPEDRGVGPFGDQSGSRTFAGPGPTGDVELLWMLDIPDGYEPGSPVASGNRLLVTSTSEEFGSNLTVYDLADGTFLWNHAEPAEFSDPYVSDGRVYLKQGARLVALDLENGSPVWDVTLAGEDAEDVYDVDGIAASDGAVYVSHGDTLLALDGDTGEETWRRTFEGYAMDYRVVIGGDVVIVSSSVADADGAPGATRLHGISRATGHEVWRHEIRSEVTEYMASFDGKAVYLDEHPADDVESVNAVVLDGDNGQVIWSPFDTCGTDYLQFGIYGGAYACYDSGTLLDIMTGQLMEPAGIIHDDWFVNAAAGNLLYISDTRSRIEAVDMTTGEQAWAFDVAGLSDAITEESVVLFAVSIGTDAAVVRTLVLGDEDETLIFVLGDPTAPNATPPASPAA